MDEAWAVEPEAKSLETILAGHRWPWRAENNEISEMSISTTGESLRAFEAKAQARDAHVETQFEMLRASVERLKLGSEPAAQRRQAASNAAGRPPATRGRARGTRAHSVPEPKMRAEMQGVEASRRHRPAPLSDLDGARSHHHGFSRGLTVALAAFSEASMYANALQNQSTSRQGKCGDRLQRSGIIVTTTCHSPWRHGHRFTRGARALESGEAVEHTKEDMAARATSSYYTADEAGATFRELATVGWGDEGAKVKLWKRERQTAGGPKGRSAAFVALRAFRPRAVAGGVQELGVAFR